MTLFPFLELAVFVVSDLQCKGSKTPGGLSGSKQVTVILTMLLLLWLLCRVVCMAAQHAPLAHVQNILDIRVFATREYYHHCYFAFMALKCTSKQKPATHSCGNMEVDHFFVLFLFLEILSIAFAGWCMAHMDCRSRLCVRVCLSAEWVCILLWYASRQQSRQKTRPIHRHSHTYVNPHSVYKKRVSRECLHTLVMKAFCAFYVWCI